MPDYKCLECGELFECRTHCIMHHMDTKHSNFEMIGTDVKMTIKI